MIDPFLGRALLAGLGAALAAGPLGALVLWRRMAFIGDAMAHAAVLGVALSLAMALPVGIGIVAIALAVALVMASMVGKGLAADSLLGVVAHSALAMGLVVASFLQNVRIDIEAYLFGDILAVGPGDVALIWAGAVITVIGLWRNWGALLTAALGADLAIAAGINPRRQSLLLMLGLALFVALGIKVVGALLVSALLILPASAARFLSRTPEAMALLASLIAGASVVLGLFASWWLDTPAGPSIVVEAALAFPLTMVAGRKMVA